MMTQTNEPTSEADNITPEVDESTTVKEDSQAEEDGTLESAIKENDKPNRREKVKAKLDSKDETIEQLNQRLSMVEENADKQVTALKY